MAINPNLPVHDGSKFTWHNGHGSIERSDFNGRQLMSRVYDDACDEGFYIVSHKTGKKVLFTYNESTQPFVDDGPNIMVFTNPEMTISVYVFND
jgi:hypothetical protein